MDCPPAYPNAMPPHSPGTSTILRRLCAYMIEVLKIITFPFQYIIVLRYCEFTFTIIL